MLILKRFALILGGIACGVALFVLPDMFVPVGETTSFSLKIVLTIALLLISMKSAHKSGSRVFTIAACVALVLLLIFGTTIRVQEMGL